MNAVAMSWHETYPGHTWSYLQGTLLIAIVNRTSTGRFWARSCVNDWAGVYESLDDAKQGAEAQTKAAVP